MKDTIILIASAALVAGLGSGLEGAPAAAQDVDLQRTLNEATAEPDSYEETVTVEIDAEVEEEAPAEGDGDDYLSKMFSGKPFLEGDAMAAALAEADKFPLGSSKNPVRVSQPQGQRAYLRRLRCPGGDQPAFGRVGNVGPGVFDSIVDLYEVECADGSVHEIYMDMYHAGHVEDRPVPGFTITP
ncbi:hypothetical protein [Paraurantiacibacter namhicola]|uniref:Uncharacterized protein n=1 Tax=Paraurantiacibacter namhicola TaxID=645517 RepID=A0A1C7D6N2_9SPHN|nr:hypothetical protein [Paraurantiacibacter namhicola]ANU07012.1 hypothetical protein A6F65_00690 [Paraurantiacibacter namhicola]